MPARVSMERVDRVIDAGGKLVAPGFIDTHVHSGHRASHRLISDTGRPMYYGRPFLEISVPKEGRIVKGDLRYLKHGDAGRIDIFKPRRRPARKQFCASDGVVCQNSTGAKQSGVG